MEASKWDEPSPAGLTWGGGIPDSAPKTVEPDAEFRAEAEQLAARAATLREPLADQASAILARHLPKGAVSAEALRASYGELRTLGARYMGEGETQPLGALMYGAKAALSDLAMRSSGLR